MRRERMRKTTDERSGYGVTHTLAETARMMGISRERVRQIEKRALEKLQLQLRQRYGITRLDGIL
ncbi:MAG: hypothetical protein J6U40_07420 [Kiritimatiellae bacterium]|nr:hypothetical protein [Kiritimatiellia bacterium]